VASKLQASIWNRQRECLPADQLEALQLKELRGLLERLQEKVPFYRNGLKKSGVTVAQIKSLNDLKRCPLTTKADLRDHYPFGFFAEPLDKVARIHASSGTKGKSTIVGYTKVDLGTWAEICARSLACAGVQAGDIAQNSYGYGLFTGGLGLHYGAEKLGATVVPASSGRTQNQITLLNDLGARVLCCTPSYALNIGYTLEEIGGTLGISRKNLKLEIGVFGAETWTEELRRQIENKLGIKALDIYGMSEIMGPGVSMECWQGAHKGLGLHVWEDQFLVEVLDPKTGESLQDGEEGELVFTTLTKEALPLLRYRTGDLSSLNHEPCSCGRTMVRMARINARIDDMLIIRGVNLYPSEVEKVLLRFKELAPHYQLIVERDRALDSMQIEVELHGTFYESFSESFSESSGQTSAHSWGSFSSTHPELMTLRADIQLRLKDTTGVQADVILLKPNSIPRSEGKAERVIDRRTERNENNPVLLAGNQIGKRAKNFPGKIGQPR
jgi:phenylacetate-CoA ligase